MTQIQNQPLPHPGQPQAGGDRSRIPGLQQPSVANDASFQAMPSQMMQPQAPQTSASRTQAPAPVRGAAEEPGTGGKSSRRNKNKATAEVQPQSSGASGADLAPAQGPNELTTVMLRNLPNRYTREMLRQMLDAEGFAGRYTFVYLPIDFKTHSGLGYAFVDLVSSDDALRLRTTFEVFQRWLIQSEKVCSVGWSAPAQQGLSAHVDRYRNSPVMHFSVSDEWKPAVFVNGQRVPFPPPTRRLRAPNLRMLPQNKNP